MKVLDGVFNPIKYDACRGSILNFANRKQEKRVTTNIRYGSKRTIGSPISFKENIVRLKTWNKTNPGTTPNVTISARESSCLPNSELALTSRATKPSKKSRMPATTTNNAAVSKCPLNKLMMARQPQNRFIKVIKLGKCLIIIQRYIYRTINCLQYILFMFFNFETIITFAYSK